MLQSGHTRRQALERFENRKAWHDRQATPKKHPLVWVLKTRARVTTPQDILWVDPPDTRVGPTAAADVDPSREDPRIPRVSTDSVGGGGGGWVWRP